MICRSRRAGDGDEFTRHDGKVDVAHQRDGHDPAEDFVTRRASISVALMSRP
jgi:hypothetical protein